MRKVFIVFAVLLFMTSCTNNDGTIAFLKEQGYSNIQITGFDFFAHGEDDWTTTGFIATSPTGNIVKGAISDKGPINFLRARMSLRIWEEK